VLVTVLPAFLLYIVTFFSMFTLQVMILTLTLTGRKMSEKKLQRGPEFRKQRKLHLLRRLNRFQELKILL